LQVFSSAHGRLLTEFEVLWHSCQNSILLRKGKYRRNINSIKRYR
jgi:hypothetical protein